MIEGWREELAAETEHRRNERITAQTPPRLVHGCRGGRAARRLLAPAAARGLPAPPAAIATERRAEHLARVWARLVAGHDREVARERALEQAEFEGDDDDVDATVPVGRKSLSAAPARSRRLVPQAHGAPRRHRLQRRDAAALQGSGYTAALIAELLVELKAAGHYDVILAEAAAAGPLD